MRIAGLLKDLDFDTRLACSVEVALRPPTVFREVSGYREPHADVFPWVLPDGRTIRTGAILDRWLGTGRSCRRSASCSWMWRSRLRCRITTADG
jgi:hypothetical protein